ncbi:uncharacterized protein LOC134274971 [Saccostrea cucullata]|uniref:uncharacterized protein LOC134274971 n=1 Tax=Saccostrea cuccullata TaxID=36930 RepID=UPI002ED2FC66
MLRVCTPATVHSQCQGRMRSPLRTDVANELRQHIIELVKEQTDENIDMNVDDSAIIYQLKKKGGIAPIEPIKTKEDKQNEKVKRIHLKMLKETRSKGANRFPALDFGDVSHRDDHLIQSDPRTASAKTVRFKMEDSNAYVPENQNPGYEVRGNAIKSSSGLHKSVPLILRRTEAAQRQAQIHTSLQVFKRRLKINNQNSYLAPNSTVRESDYIIRRVPLQLDKKSRTNITPIAPRISVSSKLHARPRTPTSARQRVGSPLRPTSSTSRPLSGSKSPIPTEEKKVKFSYRLPDNIGKELFREDSEIIPSVNTYVVEETQAKFGRKYETQAMLNVHNLGVHDALNSGEKEKVRIHEDTKVDSRLIRWVEESTNINFTRRINRIRSASTERFYRSESTERLRTGSADSKHSRKFLEDTTQTNSNTFQNESKIKTTE